MKIKYLTFFAILPFIFVFPCCSKDSSNDNQDFLEISEISIDNIEQDAYEISDNDEQILSDTMETPTCDLKKFFKTGQKADLMLSGIDFNNTGGPLLFNHPGGIATDGQKLFYADRNNNRVLIWNTLPQSNVPPDLVLGQKDFISNNPGTGPDNLNWPVSVSVALGKIVVADTYNERVLIWKGIPTVSGKPADMIIKNLKWPWGVWTDGKKLAISQTQGSKVNIWNVFPESGEKPSDITLTANGLMGTPRTITTDGSSFFIVGDHNAKATGGPQGDFVWKNFPTSNEQPFDFFMTDPLDSHGAWLQGDITANGTLVLLGSTLHLWYKPISDSMDKPDLSIDKNVFQFNGGDGSDIAVAGNKLYISTSNGNRILVYNDLPTSPSQKPDYAIGTPDINTNTLETNYMITNPVPATDGESLFVSSDFDRKLYIWKKIPSSSGVHPDYVLKLQEAPWDNALWEGKLVLAGRKAVYVWNSLPVNGESPEITYNGKIGNVEFNELGGVALDDNYLYLADGNANKIYIWEGIPEHDAVPKYTIEMTKPGPLSCDGNYLVVNPYHEGQVITVYKIDEIANGGNPVHVGGPGKFNLPGGALISCGHLFVADTCFNRVQAWQKIEDAMSGKQADVILGEDNFEEKTPQIGENKLFWPSGLAFDGKYLWVGEFKFSGRIVRFSIK